MHCLIARKQALLGVESVEQEGGWGRGFWKVLPLPSSPTHKLTKMTDATAAELEH